MRNFLCLLMLWLAFTSFSAAQTSPLNGSRQMILVTTVNWDAVPGRLQRYERQDTKSKWQKVGEAVKIVVGVKGLGVGVGLHNASGFSLNAPVKKEGDKKSPAGVFELTSVFGSVEKPIWLKMPFIKLVESTECVDDVKSSKYNSIVDRYKVGNFDWNSSEKMLSVGEQYAWGIFVAHNAAPPKAGKGSCIFLHIWQNADSGTVGCTAMQKADIEEILRWLEPEKNPVLVQLPETEYNKLQKTWKLPKNK